jgi:hypothetical protein
LRCFDKDVNTRATAHQLLSHPWIVKSKVIPVHDGCNNTYRLYCICVLIIV